MALDTVGLRRRGHEPEQAVGTLARLLEDVRVGVRAPYDLHALVYTGGEPFGLPGDHPDVRRAVQGVPGVR